MTDRYMDVRVVLKTNNLARFQKHQFRALRLLLIRLLWVPSTLPSWKTSLKVIPAFLARLLWTNQLPDQRG